MIFDIDLLESAQPSSAPESFRACLNAHGSYTPSHFVLRLSPRNHELISSIGDRTVIRAGDVDPELIQAFSTYLHETVHWWQHKGSTSGFIRSMLYPAQSHLNFVNLKELSDLIGPKKSIRTWAEAALIENRDRPVGTEQMANTLVNNFLDSEFYLALTYDPRLAEEIYYDRYFESAGHSFHIAYTHVIRVIQDTVDREHKGLLDIDDWEDRFQKLSTNRTQGYFYGTPIQMAPLGLFELLEGQARFIQLQFLSSPTGVIRIKEAHDAGLLFEEYGYAFRVFLQLTESEEPEFIEDPLVALFLLICDLSINPTEGFPSKIKNFESFYLDADPGIRFANLCQAVPRKHPEFRTLIKNYSKEEYLHVADSLSGDCGYENPIEALKQVMTWENDHENVAEVMKEHETFDFQPGNLPIRVLLSQFISFTRDKIERPEFFCWAGVWMTGERAQKAEADLWLKHLSLFSDRADDGGVFPRIIPGRSPTSVQKTFDQFFWTNMLYDLVKQWVIVPGLFKMKFRWLTTSIPAETMEASSKDGLEKRFGVKFDDFEYVPSQLP